MLHMPQGYMNRFLLVDLTNNTFEISSTKQDILEEYIGGKALGLKLMLDDKLISQDPFSPENPLIFATGPITGTLVQTSARSVVVTKSPLTGTFLDTHAGGHFGPAIKRAGFDYIYITGKAKKQTYLHVTENGVAFEDASKFWGKGIFFTEKSLLEKYSKAKVASIGPAGENRVRFACIGTDLYRQYGRGGAGAVMGSKNLKAIVVEGNQKIEYHDKNGFMALNKILTEDIMKHPNRQRRYDLGTNMWIRMGQEEGRFLPVNNWKECEHQDYEKLTSETMKKELNWKSVGCFNCNILCSKLAKWTQDNHQYEVEGPEYETSAYLGSGCGIFDAKTVAYANMLCDDFGLDTISTGNVVSFAMEAFEKGLVTEKDTDHLQLKFGNGDAALQLIERIAYRTGIGDLLAEGTKLAAKKIGKGSDFFAIQTSGMELSGTNIKGTSSMGLGLATADFASHTRIWSSTAEMRGNLTFESAPDWIKAAQDEIHVRNSLIVCDFFMFGFDRILPVLEKITGRHYEEKDALKLGEKVSALTRMYALKNGRTRKDDTLPGRFFEEKHFSGLFKDKTMTREIFDRWVNTYYEKRGWDHEGVPTKAKLSELGISRI